MHTIDIAAWLLMLEDRFGFPPDIFAPYRVEQPNPKYLTLVARDHTPPFDPKPSSTGIPFLRINLPYPKPTTAAAMMLGPHATRNVVELDRTQADVFLSRRNAVLTEQQTICCTGIGYVIVRHAGISLGLGLYRPEPDGGVLESLYPKAHALH